MSGPSASDASSGRRRPWSLYIFIAWTVVLTFNTGVILFLWDITGSPLAQFNNPTTLIGWMGLVVAFIAPFAFGASAYGLWELRSWGRHLFLTITVLFFGFNLITAWLPGGVPPNLQGPIMIQRARLFATLRYSLALAIPVIYFNLTWIKPLFQKPPDRQVAESTDS